MAGYPPLKDAAHIDYFPLVETGSSPPAFKANPAISAGDFKISIDGGVFANLTNLPVVTPAGGREVKFSFTAAEMNGDNIVIECVDAAGAEWDDFMFSYQPSEFQIGLDLVRAIWDRILTGATHNIMNSAGKLLRQAGVMSIIDSAVDDPGAAATTTVFNTDLTEVDDYWNDQMLVFANGSLLAGQAKPILDYSNTNGQITLAEALTSAPEDDDEFQIISIHVHPVTQIAAAIWDTVITGVHTTADSAGVLIGNVIKWLGLPVPSLNSAQIIKSVAADNIVDFRGDDWSITTPATIDITGHTNVWFSMKNTGDDSEDDALIRISETVGLERFLKASATAGDGSLVVDDASTGVVTITLDAELTAQLTPGAYIFDFQWIDGSDKITTMSLGTFVVAADVTLATE